MLSQATKYAVRAVLYLAIHSDPNSKFGAKHIASELELPSPYLAKLLQVLTARQIISSSKGPTGGFFLTDEDRKQCLWNIVEAIDGNSKFEQCFLGLSLCDDQNPCPVHHIAAPFKEQITTLFKERTIGDLAANMESDKTLISLKGLEIMAERPPSK
jgi:Rrf2 family protein